MGRGQFAKASVQLGQRVRGFELSFVEPYLLGYRMAGGIDLFARQNLASSYVSYDTETYGTNLRLGFALTEEISFAPRYSIYRQEITLPDQYNNCANSAAAIAFRNGIGPGVQPGDACYADGEASLAVRRELSGGPVTVSLVGYSLSYNTVDNNRMPTSGLLAEIKQDLAGVGGDVNFIRTSGEVRNYYEVSAGRRQRAEGAGRPHRLAGAARTCACWIISRWVRTWSAASRRTASVRAISRRAPIPTTRSAARCTGAPRRKCRRRSTSCRRKSASRLRPSRTPDRSGAIRVRRRGR